MVRLILAAEPATVSTVSGVLPAHEALIALIPRLRRYARLLCADAASSDDLVQETLERACSRLSSWRPGSDLRAWVFAIMHNLFVSEIRRPRHRFERPIETASEWFDAAQQEGHDPAVSWGLAVDLERALRQLPDVQRQILLLIAFEDMSYEQVADVLGVPVGTVMSRLSRGRARLRQLMERDTPARPKQAPRLRVLK